MKYSQSEGERWRSFGRKIAAGLWRDDGGWAVEGRWWRGCGRPKVVRKRGRRSRGLDEIQRNISEIVRGG